MIIKNIAYKLMILYFILTSSFTPMGNTNVQTIQYIKGPDKFDTLKMDPNRWILITNSIDLNKFYQLPSKVGCPDCDDGGEEWIEIGTKDKIHKVRFEYRHKIESLNGLLEQLK